MKNINTLILLLLIASTGFGQSLSPRVTATAGGRATGGGVSLSYTTGETFNTMLSANNQQLTQGQQQPEIDLRVGITQAFACAGNNILVPFTADGYVDAANTFTVQLSDANGSFANAVTIGSSTSLVSGNITATVPAGLNGSGYKARVVSSNPSRISSDLVSVTVNTIPNATASITQPTCASATGTINVTSPSGAGLTYSIGGSYQSSTTFSGLQAGTYNVTVQNGAGCSSAEATSVTVNPQPIVPLPTTINGQVNVCNVIGTGTAVSYTASAQGATSYTWTLPPNTVMVSGQGTATISVKFLSGFLTQSNKQLRVVASSSCGSNVVKIYYLSAQLPTTPLSIATSTSNVCPSIGTNIPVTYKISKVSGASSYIWNTQSNTTSITHPNGIGENDTLIIVTFTSGFTSSSVTVQAVNSCGTSGTRSVFVSRNNPSTPGLISGPTNACAYTGTTGIDATYTIPSVSTVDNYMWTLPSGVINVSGQGSNTISFRYPAGFMSGTVSVTATNGCGTSSSRSLNITRLLPSTPGNIDVINLATCPNRIYSYSVATLPSNVTSMEWSIPAGGTIVSGQGTISIIVSYAPGVIDGLVTVRSINNCGASSYKNSIVKLAPCPSGTSTIYTKSDGNNANSLLDVKVFPNPTTTFFNVQVITANSKEVNVRVLDVQGRLIKSMTIVPYQTATIGSELKAGVYMLEVKQGDVVKTVRVVKY